MMYSFKFVLYNSSTPTTLISAALDQQGSFQVTYLSFEVENNLLQSSLVLMP